MYKIQGKNKHFKLIEGKRTVFLIAITVHKNNKLQPYRWFSIIKNFSLTQDTDASSWKYIYFYAPWIIIQADKINFYSQQVRLCGRLLIPCIKLTVNCAYCQVRKDLINRYLKLYKTITSIYFVQCYIITIKKW